MSRWLPPWGIRPVAREPEPPPVPAAEAVKAVADLLRERDEERGRRRGAELELAVARARIEDLSAQLKAPASQREAAALARAEQDRRNCLAIQKQLDETREELRQLTLEHGWVTGRNMAQDFNPGQRTGVG